MFSYVQFLRLLSKYSIYDSQNNCLMPTLPVTMITFTGMFKESDSQRTKGSNTSQPQWQGPVIPGFRRLVYQFKVSLSYEKPYHTKQNSAMHKNPQLFNLITLKSNPRQERLLATLHHTQKAGGAVPIQFLISILSRLPVSYRPARVRKLSFPVATPTLLSHNSLIKQEKRNKCDPGILVPKRKLENNTEAPHFISAGETPSLTRFKQQKKNIKVPVF